MFTLRFISDAGSIEPDDLPADGSTEPFRSAHAATARRAAAQRAVRHELSVVILRDGKPCYIMDPDGRTKPPPGVQVDKRAVCTRERGTCFCNACRIERREARTR